MRASCDVCGLEAGSYEDQYDGCLYVYMNPSELPCGTLAMHWQSCILVVFARDVSMALVVEGVDRSNHTHVAWAAPFVVGGRSVGVVGAAVVAADGGVGVVRCVSLGWMHRT